MASADAELEKQLKEAGKHLSNPHDSVDTLLHLLDKVEKLLLRVDQSPKKSMLDALKPSMNALIKDSLSKHSDMDVKVAVASCISEITRITAPDAPYTDDQMRDVFELIVSSFEDLSDRSSRSYNKRASILETVSKVRSCVIMLDLECDELIVKMFEHFLKSVRDFHLDSVFSSMENIMVLVIDESEEISVEMLKPLLASVKKDRVGVLPVAHKLGKGVLLKSAEKLKPYMMPALTSLGESLDTYHKVVAAICEGTTANFENKDDNDSGPQLTNECKLEKGSVDEMLQADESKLTTASSDHVDQVVKLETCSKEEADPTVENRSPKSVMSNGVNETVKEEASVNQESKKSEEDKIQEPLNKEDTDDSDADKLAKGKSQTEKIPIKSKTEADTTINSVEPSDSFPVEGDKEIEKDNDVKESENEKDNDVKESENEKDKDVQEPENEKDKDVQEPENEKEKDVQEPENEKEDVQEPENEKEKDVQEPENEKEKDVQEPENEKEKDVQEPENEKEKDVQEPENEKEKDVQEPENEKEEVQEPENEKEEVQELENEKDSDVKELENQNENDDKGSENEAAIPSETEKDKDTVQELSPKAVESKPAATADVSSPSQNNSVLDESSVRSKTKPVPLEVEAASPSKSGPPPDETHVKKAGPPKNKDLTQEDTPEAQKQAGKKTPIAKEVKLVDTVNKSEDGEASSDSDGKPLKKSEPKSKSTKQSGKKSKQSGKKLDVGESDTKKPKQSGNNVEIKGDESDSDCKPLKLSVKKGEKSKIAIEEEEEHDSDNKPLKLSAKKSTSKKKDDGKKRGNGKNVAEKDQAKSVLGDDEMDISPKSTTKSATRDKRKIAVEKEEEHDSDDEPLKLPAKGSSKKKDDGKKRGNSKNVAEKDQAKSLSGDDEMDVSPKSAPKSATREGNSTETSVTSAKRKRSTGKDEGSNTIKYDESLVGTKVKVWWPEDKMYYEGVVAEFYPAKKKHKVSYVDGDVETLNLRTQKWEILKEFSVRKDEEQNTEVHSEEGSPEMHKKKKSKTDPAASQEKTKDSAKKVSSVSSSGKSKGLTPKDNKSAQKTSGKSSDAAATTSKEAAKSKEDEETLKTSSKTKMVNKSKAKTPSSSGKSSTTKSNAKEPEAEKSTENTKGGSNSGKKRKKM